MVTKQNATSFVADATSHPNEPKEILACVENGAFLPVADTSIENSASPPVVRAVHVEEEAAKDTEGAPSVADSNKKGAEEVSIPEYPHGFSSPQAVQEMEEKLKAGSMNSSAVAEQVPLRNVSQ